MRTDDAPVIGESPPEPRDDPKGGRLFALVAAIGAVVVAFVALGDEGFDPAVPLPEPQPVTTTTTLPRPVPEMVNETLAWERTSGLGEAIQISEVIEVGGSYMAVGATQEGLAVWSSEDGVAWAPPEQLSTRSGGVSVVGAESINGVPFIVENHTELPPDGGGASVWSRNSKGEWAEQVLHPLGPSTVIRAQDVGVAGGRIVVVGISNWRRDPAPALEALTPEVASLITSGQATLTQEVGGARVLIEPDRLVHSVDLATEPVLAPTRSLGRLAWIGAEAGALELTGGRVVSEVVGVLADGRLVGRSTGRGYVTSDGVEWSRLPADIAGQSPVVWADGVAALNQSGQVVDVVDVDTGEVAAISPLGDRLADQPLRLSGLSAGDVGLAAVGLSTDPSASGDDVQTVVGGDDETIVQLIGASRLEILEAGDTVFDGTVHTAPLGLDVATGRLVFSHPDSGEALLSLTVREWLSGVEVHAYVAGSRASGYVIHSPDGNVWSSTPWWEITGDPTPIRPTVIATDELVLAVDQGVEGGPLAGAWVGAPET